MHGVYDRVDVFLFFLFRVGVVEAQVAAAAVIARQAEVQADRFGVAEVQVAVGLRRETCADARRIERTGQLLSGEAGLARPAALRVLSDRQVGVDDVADEIGRRSGSGGGFLAVFWHVAHGMVLGSRSPVF